MLTMPLDSTQTIRPKNTHSSTFEQMHLRIFRNVVIFRQMLPSPRLAAVAGVGRCGPGKGGSLGLGLAGRRLSCHSDVGPTDSLRVVLQRLLILIS
jgi:hypothetical protein